MKFGCPNCNYVYRVRSASTKCPKCGYRPDDSELKVAAAISLAVLIVGLILFAILTPDKPRRVADPVLHRTR